jgi:hypothetical protein
LQGVVEWEVAMSSETTSGIARLSKIAGEHSEVLTAQEDAKMKTAPEVLYSAASRADDESSGVLARGNVIGLICDGIGGGDRR